MKSSYCYWTHEDQEYEVHYCFDEGGIIDYYLYPEENFQLSREQEREIAELIHDDMENVA